MKDAVTRLRSNEVGEAVAPGDVAAIARGTRVRRTSAPHCWFQVGELLPCAGDVSGQNITFGASGGVFYHGTTDRTDCGGTVRVSNAAQMLSSNRSQPVGDSRAGTFH